MYADTLSFSCQTASEKAKNWSAGYSWEENMTIFNKLSGVDAKVVSYKKCIKHRSEG